MMQMITSEQDVISSIKSILDNHIPSYTLDIIQRRRSTASSMDVSFAVLIKDKQITQELITDLINYQIQNENSIEFVETKKELGNLDFEVIIINAEIQYLG